MQSQGTAQLPDAVLQWLWKAVQNEYQSPQAVYTDAVAALTAFPSFQPRTDVYTYNNGQPALLLCLIGTLPVNFRGTIYRFPLRLWVPHAHPSDPEGVIVYVMPGDNMMIRPGQHVSVDGRVYHPYLRDWATRPQSTVQEFLRVLQEVFAREPPVIAKPQPQQQTYHQPQSQPQPGPSVQRPPPPPKARPGSIIQQQPIEMPASPKPPLKPPKPGEQARGGTPMQHAQKFANRDGPPLPPLPHERPQQRYQSPQPHHPPNGFATPPRPQSTYIGDASIPRGPPLPPLPSQFQGRDTQPYPRDSPVSPVSPNVASDPGQGVYSGCHPDRRSSLQAPPPHPPQQYQQQYQQLQYRQPPQPQQQQPPRHQQYPTHQPQLPTPQNQQHQQFRQPTIPKPAAPQPPIDLMSDPFDVSLPAHPTQSGPPPPIPPNPEKEHLLHMLSTSLVSQSHQMIQQSQSALPALRSQGQAMAEAHHRLQQELAQIEHLDRTLSTNESILRASMEQCDKIIADSKNMPEPAIDDVLVAPTLVQNQLWSVEADIAGLKEVLWVMQRAMSEGRVAAADFVKLNRTLARELFLKMALSRKIAKGLGLDLGIAAGSSTGRVDADEGFYT